MKIPSQYYLWIGMFAFASAVLFSQWQNQKDALQEVQKLGGTEASSSELVYQIPEESNQAMIEVSEAEQKKRFLEALPENPNLTIEDTNPPSMNFAIESSRQAIEKVMGNQPFNDVFLEYMEDRFRRAGEEGTRPAVQLPQPNAEEFKLIQKHLEDKESSIESLETMEFFRAAMSSPVDKSEKLKLVSTALAKVPKEKPYATHLITEVMNISNSNGLKSTELETVLGELNLDDQLNKSKESLPDPLSQ